MSKFIARATYWVFAAISLWIFISKCSSGTPVLTFLIAAASLLAISFLSYPAIKLFNAVRQRVSNLSTSKMPLIIFAMALIPRVVSTLLLDCDFSIQEDMAAPQSFVSQLLSKGCITENASYAKMYGRYVNTAFFLYPWAAVFGSSSISVSLFFNLAYSLCYVGWFNVLKRYRKPSTAFTAVLLFSLLWTEVWLSVLPIHESALFICLSAFAWICFDLLPRLTKPFAKAAAAVCGGIIFAVGISCNSMGYIALVAFVLYMLAKALRGGAVCKRLLLALLSVLILAGLIFAVKSSFTAIREEVIEITGENDRRPTKVAYGWSLYVGFNYESNGKWTREDYNAFYPSKEQVGDEQLYGHQSALLNERLSRYKEHPFDTVLLFDRKVYEAFGGYNYGIRRCLQYTGNSAAQALYKDVFPGIKGVFHVISMILLGFLLLTFSKKKQYAITPALWLKAMFCGVFFVLLVVEVLPKYAVCLWAILFFILVIDSDVLAERSEKLNKLFKDKLLKKK